MEKLLLENSTKKYAVYHYRGSRFNHMAHGLIALHELGMGEEVLEKFAKDYSSFLEDPQKYPKEFDSFENIDDVKGQRKGFYPLVDHYEKVLKDKHSGSVKDLIKKEFPKVEEGMAAHAFHGVIHVGYGCKAQCARVVCEGLAFLHCASVPLIRDPAELGLQTFGHGDKSILEVLEMIKNDNDLNECFNKSLQEWDPSLPKHYFTVKMRVLMKHLGGRLSRYANQINLSEIFTQRAENHDVVPKLMKWLVDSAVIVYAGSDIINDFFLLHGVTSAWALIQIVALYDDPKEIIKTLQIYLCCLLAAYISVGCPNVSLEKLLTDAQQCDMTWESIIEKAATRMINMKDGDEHIFKLVQVCWDMHNRFRDAKMSAVYRKAAVDVVTHEFVLTKLTH